MNKSSNAEGRIDKQLELIEARRPDVLMLQEVRYGADDKWLQHWIKMLDELGLGEIEHTCDWACALGNSNVPPHSDIGHDNGHVTAVNSDWKLDRREPTIRAEVKSNNVGNFDTHFPEKLLITELETSSLSIDLWNIRAVPGNGWGEEKIKILEMVYRRLNQEAKATRIVAGDFNTPKTELADGQAIPFGQHNSEFGQRKIKAELQILKGLGHLGLRDVFREKHGYGDLDVVECSWQDKRFDHMFATSELVLSHCAYDQAGLGPSDHAPLIVDFEIKG